MATKTVTMGTASIGPAAWRNSTLRGIEASQNALQKSDKNNMFGRSMNPLPNLREVLAELSNDEAHRYFRHTRSVVGILRESLIDTNEEIKSLTRGKEALEKAIEHARKDIKLNEESSSIRDSRPKRERDHDGADDLLEAERAHLLNLKRMLEAQLVLVQQQLQVLDKGRLRLSNVISERSRVLDLVCHAIPGGSVSASMTSRRMMSGPRSRLSMSADMERSGGALGMSTGGMTADPLGPLTPECEAALQDAQEARERSASLRKDLNSTIGKVDRIQKSCHQSVNSGLTGKLAETVGFKQQLDIAAGENRHAINRAHRWYDHTEKAWGYSRGPLNYGDLFARERLDRPVISMFQRHPGTNLPEAQHIVKGGDGLLQSLQTTSRNIGLLKLAQLNLQDDLRDKKSAIDIDSSIIRMRRRKANHRWSMDQKAF